MPVAVPKKVKHNPPGHLEQKREIDLSLILASLVITSYPPNT